jgi:hypothetical protein
MSSASTIGLPFFNSTFISPTTITNGTLFNYGLINNFNIPVGNYLAWIFLAIRGDTDTELGPVITVINNGVNAYPFTSNTSTVALDGDTLAFQNTQVISITNAGIINLQGQINFNNNAPGIAGIIYLYPV